MRQLGLDASRPPAPPIPAADAAEAPAGKRPRVEAGGAAPLAAATGGAVATASGRLPTAVVLDIEGTIASISYVTEVLFPYARARLRCVLSRAGVGLAAAHGVRRGRPGVVHGGRAAALAPHAALRRTRNSAHATSATLCHFALTSHYRPTLPCRSTHLESTYDSAETQEDLALLRAQAAEDAAAGLAVPAVPGPEAGRDAVVAGAVANCEAQMDGDRKTTALKSLQVRGRGGRPVGSCRKAGGRVRGHAGRVLGGCWPPTAGETLPAAALLPSCQHLRAA